MKRAIIFFASTVCSVLPLSANPYEIIPVIPATNGSDCGSKNERGTGGPFIDVQCQLATLVIDKGTGHVFSCFAFLGGWAGKNGWQENARSLRCAKLIDGNIASADSYHLSDLVLARASAGYTHFIYPPYYWHMSKSVIELCYQAPYAFNKYPNTRVFGPTICDNFDVSTTDKDTSVPGEFDIPYVNGGQ